MKIKCLWQHQTYNNLKKMNSLPQNNVVCNSCGLIFSNPRLVKTHLIFFIHLIQRNMMLTQLQKISISRFS